MRRAAIALGSEVPAGAFEFRVHSVFASAMNLAVKGRRGLLTLVGADADALPQGIRLATRERFADWPTPAGTRGRREGGALVFELADGEEPVIIDLPVALPAARRAPPRIDPGAERTREAWAACALHLDGMQAEKAAHLRLAALCGTAPPPTLLGARLADAARELGTAVRVGDAGAAGRSAARVVGLGTGLTPSGDDFLCGLLAALWCTSREGDADRCFVVEWGSALANLLDATNAISATYLECAIAGCFPETLSALAAAFASNHAGRTHEDPRRALDGLCAVGHSSGVDTATGFLFGLWLRTDDDDEETRRYAP
jgi:hypothetical protein